MCKVWEQHGNGLIALPLSEGQAEELLCEDVKCEAFACRSTITHMWGEIIDENAERISEANVKIAECKAEAGRDRQLFLQVEVDNQPAMALYHLAGFQAAHTYYYRTQKTGPVTDNNFTETDPDPDHA